MNFKTYCEIENTYNNKILSQARDMGFDDAKIEYVCETKIDGANFQCSIDENNEFYAGTRIQFLKRGDSFLGYERALRNEDVENKLRKMKQLVLASPWYKERFTDVYGDDITLTVYGELCGGFYRHKDIEKVKGAVKIQGRIDYHPDNMWVPFDIILVDKTGKTFYMFNQREVVLFCKAVDLPYPIFKFVGTLDECLNYQNDFIDDTGHILWDLPIIEGNITEGVVIKPVVPLWFNNGQRVIFKNKNEKFKERICKTPKEPKEIIPMNDLEKKYFEFARTYITENRLMSVISKIGEVNEKAFGMIQGMFLKDLWKDFDKDYKDEIEKIEKETTADQFNFSKAKKEVAKETAEFIRPTFIKLINGQL